MKHAFTRLSKVLLAASAGLACLFMSDAGLVRTDRALVSEAQAVIGRPLTPMSYAGVARRTTRRAYGAAAAGAAVAAPVVVAPRAGCVQAVNAYGQVYWRCP
jgi:hypothetical protein